jgi:hypothetical protein
MGTRGTTGKRGTKGEGNALPLATFLGGLAATSLTTIQAELRLSGEHEEEEAEAEKENIKRGERRWQGGR